MEQPELQLDSSSGLMVCGDVTANLSIISRRDQLPDCPGGCPQPDCHQTLMVRCPAVHTLTLSAGERTLQPRKYRIIPSLEQEQDIN